MKDLFYTDLYKKYKKIYSETKQKSSSVEEFNLLMQEEREKLLSSTHWDDPVTIWLQLHKASLKNKRLEEALSLSDE